MDEHSRSDTHRDKIEQQIVRAYVHLTMCDDSDHGSRTVILARLGSIEIRLTKTPFADAMGMPPVWLEVYSHPRGATDDSLGCFGFDEDELRDAVDFVCEAEYLHQTRQ